MYEGYGQYAFTGTHASRVKELVSFGFFPRNLDVLLVAPIVGFEYGVRAAKNNQDDDDTKIFLEQLQKADSRLELNYKTIMLLDKEHEPDEETRIKKAFQVSPEERSQSDLDRYEEYVRGGVDFLYEKIIGTGNTPDERVRELYDLVDSFASRYQRDEV